MKSNEIEKFLKKLGIKNDDLVMIHGDAIVAAQLSVNQYDNNPLSYFLNSLIEYFIPNGTLVVPTFTYCMNENDIFDKNENKSQVGLFSEEFRKKKNVIRSNHPMFSVGIVGKHTEKLTNYNLSDCFGKDSFFDKFTKLNGKIICLGCPLERITYIHYIEQKCKVHYRYIKDFNCAFKDNGKTKKIKISYYVRDLNKNASLDFKYYYPKIKKIIKESNFGRFKASAIDVKKLSNATKLILKNYPDILVGNKNGI